MIRQLMYYGTFIAVSLLVHYVVIRPPWGPLRPRVDPREAAATMMEIAAIAREVEALKDGLEKKAAEIGPSTPLRSAQDERAGGLRPAQDERKEMPAPEPKVEAARPSTPLRSAQDERVGERSTQDERVEPAPKFVDAPDPRVEELEKRLAEAQVEKQRLAEEAEKAKQDAARAQEEKIAEARAAEAARQSAAEAHRAAEDARTRAEREEQELSRRLAQLEDSKRVWEVAFDESKVPGIRFAESKSEQDYIELSRFYGMKVIVYPPGKDFLATYDLATGEIELVQDVRAFFAHYHTRRAIKHGGSYWDAVADKVGRQVGRKGDGLFVMTIFPNRTAQYFGKKEVEVCRKAGVNPADIQTAICTYERRPNGTWFVKVIELRPFTGQAIAVNDFEG